jgi:hypothetical protein
MACYRDSFTYLPPKGTKRMSIAEIVNPGACEHGFIKISIKT